MVAGISEGDSMVDLSRLKYLTDELEAKYARFQAQYDELEGNYKFIVENLNEGIWQIDENLKTTFVNKRMVEMLGYEVEEMMGTPLTQYCPPEELEKLGEYIERRKEGKVEQHEFTFLRKDGSHLMTILGTSPIIKDGAFKGAIAAVADITHLKESEYICKAMADSSFDPMIVHKNGIILDVNEAFLHTFDVKREELIGKSAWEFDATKTSRKTFQDRTKDRSEVPYEAYLDTKQGTKKYTFHGKTLKFNGYSDIRVLIFTEVV